MILSENVSVKVCHQNYKYYENKGYKITKELDKKNRITVPTQYITVKWTDIPHKSNQKIELKCVTNLREISNLQLFILAKM